MRLARRPSQRSAGMRRRAGTWPWLPLSGLLHALAVSGWFWSSRVPLAAPLPRVRPPVELALDLEGTPSGRDDGVSDERALAPAPGTAPEPDGSSAAGQPPSGQPLALRSPRPASRRPGAAAAPSAAEPSTPSGSGAAQEAGASGAEPSGADAPAGGREGAQLSLDQLGVGSGSNPFLAGPDAAPTERQRLNERLRQSLRAELARRDQRLGLGPEAPALVAVKDIVMASTTPPNTTALLRVVSDASGKVTLVEVLEADRDPEGWRRIGVELEQALATQRLRVPAGSGGVTMQLRVESREQLPSGADPGFAVDVLGLPLSEGGGARSARLSVLSPIRVEGPAGPNGETTPRVSIALLALQADLVDIGAVARRLVRAYLVALDTHPPPVEGAAKETP